VFGVFALLGQNNQLDSVAVISNHVIFATFVLLL